MQDFLNRFNDIQHISNLLKVTKFNNHLLIPIKVISKNDTNKYTLIIGNKEISTTSYIELDEGIKYWAELSSSKEGGIKLSNLKKQPSLLQLDEFPISFEIDSIFSILKLDDPSSYMKHIVLEALSDSDNKFEFEFLINLLSSLEQKVLTIPFVYNQKYNFFQIQPKSNGLSFVFTTNNLGILKGLIVAKGNDFILHLITSFDNGYKYLSDEIQKHLSPYFSSIEISLQKDIDILFSFRNHSSFNI